MDIKDCKFGTRVVCTNPDYDNVIPVGAVGTIIENNNSISWVSFDDEYSLEQQEVLGYKNCKVMDIEELEVLEESSSKETNIGKLTVSLSTEDTNEIAKDILKIVLNDLNVIISDAIDNLSDGVESNEPQTFFSYYGLSDEALRKIMAEVTEDLMKDCVDLNNTESSSIQTDSHVVTEDSVLTNLLNLIEKATADGDLMSLLNLTTAYQRMKNASTI